ncbi:unnamed protein product [Allacma fusca]|uniref:Uncharacterized protein n=1 Tax=Allacma fusca TaxID=39272 RepID=A0A8J2PV58_9HEXA|nr:unnamed protein product [Allacma fusca]
MISLQPLQFVLNNFKDSFRSHGHSGSQECVHEQEITPSEGQVANHVLTNGRFSQHSRTHSSEQVFGQRFLQFIVSRQINLFVAHSSVQVLKHGGVHARVNFGGFGQIGITVGKRLVGIGGGGQGSKRGGQGCKRGGQGSKRAGEYFVVCKDWGTVECNLEFQVDKVADKDTDWYRVEGSDMVPDKLVGKGKY